MKVTLINYTNNALETLLMTKNTRLRYETDVCDWPIEKKLEHLAYMKDTIKSSLEFVDYTLLIEGVSRAFTHQFVRTRTASFQQESMRSVDVRQNGYYVPESLDENQYYHDSIISAIDEYSHMIDSGITPQDARGILPMNMLTNIFFKANLRTISQMAETRLCKRTQGEYQDVFKLIRAAILEVHPWCEDFIQAYCVATGICCFPRYENCPIKFMTIPKFMIESAKEDLRANFDNIEHEAISIAKDGRTM